MCSCNMENTSVVKQDYHFKIVLVGDAFVGKSTFLSKYLHGDGKRSTLPGTNSGARWKTQLEEAQKTIARPDKVVKLTIWDTAGQERYRSLTQSYYRGARGCFLMFDVTNPASFDNIQAWHSEVRNYTNDSVEVIILGTRCHESSKRKVAQDRAETKAYHLDCKYMDVSAETGTNVRLAFETLTDAMLAREVKPKEQTPLVESWKEHNQRIKLDKPCGKKGLCNFSLCSCS